MNRTCFLIAMALMCPAASLAQEQVRVMWFQQADALDAGHGVSIVRVLTPATVTGKPFSATVTTQTTQTHPDGSRVSQTRTMVQYRDAKGRVRTDTSEPGVPSSERITIRDPVAGVTYTLDPAKKTVVELASLKIATRAASAKGREGPGNSTHDSPSYVEAVFHRLHEFGRALWATLTATDDPNHIVEDLGTLTVNGVPARGTRITNVVPVGAIGTGREFRSVSERWLSPDLELLIKSVSTDPRFGTTTYQLTNIDRQPPAPSLFQVPAGYNIRRLIEGAGIVSNGARK